jgi:aryl-alcohol dehydrogenase-like predicted oxidoreductase
VDADVLAKNHQRVGVVMQLRDFGGTGLRVSPIGFGAMHFDSLEDENDVGSLLNQVLDAGVNLVDTARGYGRSEARIGQHLSWRRQDFVLSTKFGYGIDGVPDWTYDCIMRGVDRALGLMRTDWIDIGHLHSCPLEVLQRGEVTQALDDCVRAGKLRVAAYSGENAELSHALADARVGSVQMSLSLVDQANAQRLAEAAGRDRPTPGVLVKRALGGASWRRSQRPNDFCEGQYFDRWRALAANPAWASLPEQAGDDWAGISLRFAAFSPGVSSVLLGTQKLSNLHSAIQAVERGALSKAVAGQIHTLWRNSASKSWTGIV